VGAGGGRHGQSADQRDQQQPEHDPSTLGHRD
jgi:hypothetical protein